MSPGQFPLFQAAVKQPEWSLWKVKERRSFVKIWSFTADSAY